MAWPADENTAMLGEDIEAIGFLEMWSLIASAHPSFRLDFVFLRWAGLPGSVCVSLRSKSLCIRDGVRNF